MDDFSRHRGWWGYHRGPPEPLSITRLIGAGTLDSELAALLWLLVEGHVPVVVAAERPLAGKTTTLTALMDFLPSTSRTVLLRGSEETFDWLAEAGALGWPGAHASPLDPSFTSADPSATAAEPPATRSDPSAAVSPADPPAARADPSSTYLLASELSSHLPAYTWGVRARTAVRALQLGYGLGTTMHAGSLEDVFSTLGAEPVRLSGDEVRRLGVVIVLRIVAPDAADHPAAAPRRRAVAVHYLRPLERDGHGHLQRRPPAVLATWDEPSDSFEHFGWGITPELATRVGRSQQSFERAQAERRAFLDGLVRSGVTDVPAVRAAIRDFSAPHAATSETPLPGESS